MGYTLAKFNWYLRAVERREADQQARAILSLRAALDSEDKLLNLLLSRSTEAG